MSSKKRKTKDRKYYYNILLIALLIVITIFFSYREFSKEDIQPEEELQPEILKQVQPEERDKILPRVAIVIDDLGPNRKTALAVFNIDAALTLSIIPHEAFTVWIADEGHRRGHDIIGHIPMEAKKALRLGRGGLYTWMTDDEIRWTLEEDLDSIPHIKGISNHMGSAFTEDERTIDVVMSMLKEEGLFFLDSLTTSRSVGARLAEEQGVMTLRRDIFLDNRDDPAYMKAQWEKLVKVAQKRGYAIGIAHQKKKSIEFLEKILSKNEVIVVPLSRVRSGK